jgi:hypothetical protein
MENSVDKCKLVQVEGSICKNLLWKDSTKQNLVVDVVHDETDIMAGVEELTMLLKAPPGGCEKLCKQHPSCVETGSSCRENHTCQNLFWNRGDPVENQMTTCFELDAGGCEDGTPVLCGDISQSTSTRSPTSYSGNGERTFTKSKTNAQVNESSHSACIQSSMKFIYYTIGILPLIIL